MSKEVELSIACYKLKQAIRNGNRILTNADYEERWEDFKLRNKKLKNLKRSA